jgi:transposase
MRSRALRLRYRKSEKQFCSACPCRRLGMPRSTVAGGAQARRERRAVCWPLSKGMNDAAGGGALRQPAQHARLPARRAGVWRACIASETQHVTLTILWDENSPRSQRLQLLALLLAVRAFARTLSVTMRRTSAAGERLFVDFTGAGVPVVIDRLTGELRLAQIFVAVLGGSSFTFAGASWTQSLPHGIDAHLRTFEEIGGAPQILVPDNAKTAIVKSCLYDPQVNRTYADMAVHHGAALPPGRRSKPFADGYLPASATSGHEVIGDPTYADAILDRLVNNATHRTLWREPAPSPRKRAKMP